MRLLLDSTRCQGYGLCQDHAPELIEIDDWGYAKVLVLDVPPAAEESARACADNCPTAALRVER
ncbi:ferredoxin [Streptomyces sp. NPDC048338]|uniref:ferredoxin n=1 Tax=Streptomyces sp. NPDC048338 TaxID=3365536 RepID=UPI00371DB7E9